MSEGSEETKKNLDSTGESSDVDHNDNCISNGRSGRNCRGETETKRSCFDCGTIRTPVWRGGPAGPKSLCNACGIKKNRKIRQAALGTKPEETKKQISSSSSSDLSLDHHQNTKKKMYKNDDDPKSCNSKSSRVSKLLGLGFKVPVMKRSSVEKERLWSKLDEDERAAVLLLALSCDSVYS